MSIRINGVDKASTITTTSPKHGTYHLADNPNLYEVQRTNNFEFVVMNINNIVKAGLKDSKANRIANAQEVLRLSVSEASIPHFSQSPISVKRGNSTLKYAGVPEFTTGSLTVIDYIGADTKAVLMAWQNLSYNVITEKVGLVSDYKKDAYLIEYTPDMQVVRQWKLHGCWISELTEPNYSSEGNDKHTISVTIQYDRAEIDNSGVIK